VADVPRDETKSVARRSKPLNIGASATLRMAIKYLGAANKLFKAQTVRTEKKPDIGPWASPIYFLYFHSIELTLKAYLLSFNIDVKRIHTITKLYRQCVNRKLSLGANDRTGIANVINLLESNSKGADFRYFDPKSGGTLPELKWTRQESNKLLKTVVQSLRRKGFTAKPGGGSVVKLTGILSQPTKQ
jgi:hypothetical protein